MRTKYARLIRIGINSRRLPYLSGETEDHSYYTVFDFTTHSADQTAYAQNKHIRLVLRARARTRTWTSTKKDTE